MIFLVQTANGNTANGALNGHNYAWQANYSVEVQILAKKIFHILKIKCVDMVTDTWLLMIGNNSPDAQSPQFDFPGPIYHGSLCLLLSSVYSAVISLLCCRQSALLSSICSTVIIVLRRRTIFSAAPDLPP